MEKSIVQILQNFSFCVPQKTDKQHLIKFFDDLFFYTWLNVLVAVYKGILSKIVANEPYCLITTGAKQTLQLIIKERAERIMGALQAAAIFKLSTFPFTLC